MLRVIEALDGRSVPYSRCNCPACGKRVPVKERARPHTVESLGGPVTFTRDYHCCRHCRTGFYPVDRLLGLTDDGDLTPEMEAWVLDFVPRVLQEDRPRHHADATRSRTVKQARSREPRACALS